jgi:hypothetical protein
LPLSNATAVLQCRPGTSLLRTDRQQPQRASSRTWVSSKPPVVACGDC